MKHLAPLMALALLAGCADSDADGDGFGSVIDCDDNDVTVYPGANEFCDGVDNDCNGTVDDTYAADAVVFFIDEDGDGFGTAADSTVACVDAAPEGFVADASDCDDTDEERYPTAPELCNLKDDNCNGAVDDDPEDAPTWYADYDEDGYGSRTLVEKACDGPPGWIRQGGDCNDFDFFVNPNALEYCDRIDNDCDDVVDEADAEDHRVFYRDRDADGFGNAEEPIDACWLPEGYAEADTDCNDDPDNNGALQVPGTEEICQDGLDNNCNNDGDQCWYTNWTSPDAAAITVEGPSGSAYLGYSVEFAGDVNDDGYDDIVSGAYRSSAGGTYSGSGYLLYGMADADIPEEDLDSDELPQWNTSGSYDYTGRHMSGIGDIDRDGYADFAVGSYSFDGNTSSDGAIFVVYGKKGKFEDPVDLEAGDTATILGDQSSTYLGATIAPAGDLNGDGYVDFLGGGYFRRNSESDFGAGVVAILPGSATRYEGTTTIENFAKFEGDGRYAYLGYFGGSITSGDLNADGYSDLFLGAYGANTYEGAVYGILGDGTGFTGDAMITDVDDVNWTGNGTYAYLGQSVTMIPDLNDDGYDDLVIGDYRANSYGGACYIVFGDSSVGGGIAADRADVVINGSGSSTYLCQDRVSAADIDQDGVVELIVGSSRQSTGTSTYNGGAYIYKGGSTFGDQDEYALEDAEVVMAGPNTQYAYYGRYISTGDINGDGYMDVAVGAYGESGYAGAFYVYLGNNW